MTFEAAAVGGIAGWWAKPARAHKDVAILHAHGGWFNWGTARAFRNFAGHIALSAGAHLYNAEAGTATVSQIQGKPRVLCYQYCGGSQSGLEISGSPANWRCLVLEKFSNVKLLMKTGARRRTIRALPGVWSKPILTQRIKLNLQSIW